MIKAKSLKLRIILQFLAIIAPVTLVLVYQSTVDRQRAGLLERAVASSELATKTRENYKVFVNGIVDAVDTGRLSVKAQQALESAKATLLILRSRDRASQVQPSLDLIEMLLIAIRADQSLPGILPLRPVVNHADELLARIEEGYKRAEHHAVAEAAVGAKRQESIVMLVMVLTLGSAAYFVKVMITGLTEPLGRAVALAGSIAGGDLHEEKPIDTSNDIGGLLGSLAAMQKSLGLAFRELAKSKARLANAQRIAHIGNWDLDIASDTVTRSDEVYRILGRTRDELPDTRGAFLEIVHPQDRQLVGEAVHAAVHLGEPFNIDFRVVLPDGSVRVLNGQAEVVTDEAGKPVQIAGTIQDISERKRTEEQIRHIALHDNLTGLPNRQLFREQLAHAIAVAERVSRPVAIMFIDLDRFKNINDTLGHSVGDALLKEVSERMSKCVRKSDYVSRGDPAQLDDSIARMGGDEFTVLLTSLAHVEDAARVGRRMLEDLAKPYLIDGNELYITASIGISVFPLDGRDAEVLLKHADAAMYYAKEQGKNNCQYYAKSMNDAVSLKLSLENSLRKALGQEQFVLYYQPQVDILSGKIVGAEALIRWQHPTRGIVPPAEFITLAEECGIIVPIGEWVLETACAQANAWHRAGFEKIEIAVNLASASFRRPDLIEVLRRTLEATGLDPAYLELEVTESMLMQDLETVVERLKNIKTMGIRLSIDDFGTGYSSLSYLRHFPLDTLKIDRSFISDIDRNADNGAITHAIIAMANSLKLSVIAEGVETEDQAQFLREHGCRLVQGYLYSRPVPADDFTQLLQQHKTYAVPGISNKDFR